MPKICNTFSCKTGKDLAADKQTDRQRKKGRQKGRKKKITFRGQDRNAVTYNNNFKLC